VRTEQAGYFGFYPPVPDHKIGLLGPRACFYRENGTAGGR
jgi:hypothetical protein